MDCAGSLAPEESKRTRGLAPAPVGAEPNPGFADMNFLKDTNGKELKEARRYGSHCERLEIVTIC